MFSYKQPLPFCVNRHVLAAGLGLTSLIKRSVRAHCFGDSEGEAETTASSPLPTWAFPLPLKIKFHLLFLSLFSRATFLIGKGFPFHVIELAKKGSPFLISIFNLFSSLCFFLSPLCNLRTFVKFCSHNKRLVEDYGGRLWPVLVCRTASVFVQEQIAQGKSTWLSLRVAKPREKSSLCPHELCN